MTMRLATHKKTGRVYVGEMKPDGTGFIGQEHDVTSDFLRGVVERAERHGWAVRYRQRAETMVGYSDRSRSSSRYTTRLRRFSATSPELG